MAGIFGAGQALANEWGRPWSHRFLDAGIEISQCIAWSGFLPHDWRKRELGLKAYGHPGIYRFTCLSLQLLLFSGLEWRTAHCVHVQCLVRDGRKACFIIHKSSMSWTVYPKLIVSFVFVFSLANNFGSSIVPWNCHPYSNKKSLQFGITVSKLHKPCF